MLKVSTLQRRGQKQCITVLNAIGTGKSLYLCIFARYLVETLGTKAVIKAHKLLTLSLMIADSLAWRTPKLMPVPPEVSRPEIHIHTKFDSLWNRRMQ